MIQDEVLKLIQEVVDKEKTKTPNPDAKNGYQKLVEYNPTYVDAVRQRDRIKVHADPDYFPAILFNKRSPNQTQEQFDYVKENYQCTTNPVWIDYQSIIERSFIDTNWNIIYKPETNEGKDFEEYTTENVPIYGSVENFVTQVMPFIKGMDANGVIAVRPYRFILTENSEGDTVIDDQERFEPTIFYHDSKDVLLFEDDFALCVDDEKSLVKVGNKTAKEGRVLYLYTVDSIFKVIQVGKKSDETYAIEWQYDHDEGVVPVTRLKGVPVINKRGKIYWVSRFYYAVPLLDLALTNRNILQVSINNSVFPFRVMMAAECDFSDNRSHCVKGKLMLTESGEVSGTCSRCNGSGQAIPVSPLGAYLWEQPTALDGNTSFPAKPVEYISPDNDPLIFVRDQVEIDTNKAKSILHLQTSNTVIKGSENMTATGMAIDMKTQWAFIRAESDQMFDLWSWILERMAYQRYGGVIAKPYEVVPDLIRPTSFDFRTEQDIWNEIESARNAGAPPFVLHQLFYQLLTNIYSTSPDKQAVFETIVNADNLFSLNESEIALRKAANTIAPYELTLHHSSLQLIASLMREDDSYIDKELQERIDLLKDKAKNDTFVQTGSVIDDIFGGGVNKEPNSEYNGYPIKDGERGGKYIIVDGNKQYLSKDEKGQYKLIRE